MTNSLPTLYQEYIHLSRYARWLPDKKRRETWTETVARYFDFFQEHLQESNDYTLTKELRQELEESVLSIEALPSMRCLMTAGKALSKDNICGYNCSYVPIDDPRAFDEILYILMNGTGVGFSVERQYINKLPEVPESFHPTDTTIVVADSKLGWAKATKELISLLYGGLVPSWNLDKVRKAGTPLKTFGGRASGPEPLERLFKFLVMTFQNAKGRKLTSLECHDIVCKVAEIVVVGGVRRCLTGKNLIPTSLGYKRMDQIKVGDKVITGGKEYKVLAHINSGIQKTLIIKHRFGNLECTPNHRVAVYKSEGVYEYKEAQYLVIGDRLVWDSLGFDSENQPIPTFVEKLHFNAKKFDMPKYVTEDLAWLFGVIHGDGHISPKGFEITSADHEIEILHKANKIFREYFNLEGKISQGHGSCKRLRVNSSSLARWFNQYGIKTAENIRIPLFIMNSSKEVRYAYLAGIFDTDGRGREDGIIEQNTSVYKLFNQDIKDVLYSLGIGFTSSLTSAQKRRDNGVNARDFYTIRITGNTNRNTWVSKVAKYIITNKLQVIGGETQSPTDFSYPVHMLQKHPHGYKVDGNALICSHLIKDDIYYPTPVTDILPGAEQETYDMEIETVNRFTVNGLIVHNSALISLSNLSDDRMRVAKNGQWWELNPQRALANNSAIYTEKPDMGIFMKEWLSLYDSKSGERGMMNREAMQKQAAKNGRRKFEKIEFGSNPCSEIILRPNQFCNLSEVVVRETDTFETLKRKVRLATILGTFQSTLVNFRYLRKRWIDNTAEERLCGVSLTGIFSNSILNGKSTDFENRGFKGFKSLPEILTALKEEYVEVNRVYAETLGIPQSTAIGCIKPSGTVSQLVNSPSGIHTSHSPYYIRTIRADIKDPLAKFMQDKGFPCEPDVMNPQNVLIFSFPIKAPQNSVYRTDITAIEHLDIWLMYQDYWCEHKPSITISVKEHEWLEVATWVYKHFDRMSGISFLPFSDHIYQQAPYQDCTQAEYEAFLAKMPKSIDWKDLNKYEKTDQTEGAQELACVAGGCDI
jgi:intein/homing endonuclease